MKSPLVAVAFGAMLPWLPSVAHAQPPHRHRHVARHIPHARLPVDAGARSSTSGSYAASEYGNPSQEPLGSGRDNPYVDYDGPGSIVLNRTEQARREPGVTLELAPDAKETATGGPVGGVPGFDGT